VADSHDWRTNRPKTAQLFMSLSCAGDGKGYHVVDALSNNFHTTASVDNGQTNLLRQYKMSNPSDLSPTERSKHYAAYACAEAEIRSGMNLGVGSGSTIKYLIDWLHEKCTNGQINYINCVPTSYQTRQWLREAQIPISSIEDLSRLDLTIDGADEVDAQLTCVKGGGGCLLREKVVQTCADRFILIGGVEKYSDVLGQFYPSCAIEVVPFAYTPVDRWITEKLGGKCVLRMDQRKFFPTITENNNYILDWHFPNPVVPGTDWSKVNQTLLSIPGVVETGLFVGVAELGYFGTPEGKIIKATPNKRKWDTTINL